MSASTEASKDAQGVVEEMERAIRACFPEAVFKTRVGPDGRVYLSAYTHAAHDFSVHDLVAERAVDALIQQDVKVHVFPRRLS